MINLVELLKDCPRGMELNCTMYENVQLDYITLGATTYPIKIQTPDGQIGLNKYGCYSNTEGSKCVIFPKGKNTWEGFQRPFKDGDIVACDSSDKCTQIFIFKEYIKEDYATCHMMLESDGTIDFSEGTYYITRFATGEEKLKLFNTLKDNGYKWDNEKMSLEKSNPFYTGKVLVSSAGDIVLLSHVDNEIIYYHCILEPFKGFRVLETPKCGVGKVSNCILASKEQRDRLFDELKKSGYKYNPQANKLEKLPSFKVGNRIRSKISNIEYTITDIRNDVYIIHNDDDKFGYHVSFKLECNYELVSDKFDINTLFPLKSRVLVRNVGNWEPAFWGYYSKEYKYPFVVDGGNTFAQCIPYEGNEHLLGTSNDCDEFYKTW